MIGVHPSPSVVWVDLSRHRVTRDPVDTDLLRQVLGGRGLGAALLAQQFPPAGDPLAEDNPVIVAPGLLTGSPWPAASRYHMTFRSPLTGVYGYANAGGALGSRLAACGIGALVIRGRAEHPVYLLAEPGNEVSIRPASELWGRSTSEAECSLQAKHPGASVASIGQAGENRVLFSSVINDGGRAAARCGGGAVWGSKQLKAIAVVPGKPATPPRSFVREAQRATEKVLSCPGTAVLSRWGTPFLVALKNVVGDLPTMNRRLAQFPFADRVNADAFDRYRVVQKGCLGCPIRCGRISEVPVGRYRCRSAGPEYESIDALGPLCYCQDPEAILYANMLCNEFGMDTISTGNVLAFAMECSEQGLLDGEGPFEWGDGEVLADLIGRIARREGIGALLASGVRRAALEIGSEAVGYAMEVKGLEIPCQEPRVSKGFGLGHATSNRGADHLYALPTIDTAGLDRAGWDLLPHAMPDLLDPDNTTYKADLVKFSEEYCAVSDGLGICKFTTTETYALYPTDIAAALQASGLRLDASEVLAAGERIVNLERLLNVRLGLSAKDDRLPARFTQEQIVLDSGETKSLPADVLHVMLARYYALRGWSENGTPTKETVRRLGLDDLVGG